MGFTVGSCGWKSEFNTFYRKSPITKFKKTKNLSNNLGIDIGSQTDIHNQKRHKALFPKECLGTKYFFAITKKHI